MYSLLSWLNIQLELGITLMYNVTFKAQRRMKTCQLSFKEETKVELISRLSFL